MHLITGKWKHHRFPLAAELHGALILKELQTAVLMSDYLCLWDLGCCVLGLGPWDVVKTQFTKTYTVAYQKTFFSVL